MEKVDKVTQNLQHGIFNANVTLKYNLDCVRWKWYEWVKLSNCNVFSLCLTQ